MQTYNVTMPRQSERHDEHDLLNHYLQEIARVPRLTPERERELGFRIQQDADKVALEELVKANLRFVVSYAKRFRNAHVSFLDLINEGNIGLIQAAKKFDPDKNVKFITYAVWWIRQSILHALSEQGGAFRLPPKRANLMYRLEKAISNAISDGSRLPTAEELAAELSVPVREIELLLQASNESFSLNAELDGDSHTELGDVIEQTAVRSAEDEMQDQSAREELLQQMSQLSSKERLVLTLRHGLSDNLPQRITALAAFLGKPPAEIHASLDRSVVRLCESLEIEQGELAHLLLYTNPNPKASWTFWVALGDVAAGSTERVNPARVPHLEQLKQHGAVQSAVEKLPLEDRTILKMRYGILEGEELTLRDIGEILGLSRERVRQIEARAEAKCRRVVRRRDVR